VTAAPLKSMSDHIHITVPGSAEDPRARRAALPGVVVHYVPELHPDDVTVVNGIPVTSVARTLIDCAEEATKSELREMFNRARELGILDMAAVRAARARVEWRPSLAMLDEVIAEFS
jgi:predicted transcriptional regulator of viral defense system